MNPSHATPDGRSMHCMEIRGGAGAVEAAVTTPGLDVWVFSRPYEGATHGGDVHYLSLCGGGVITRLILADVSGHGSEVAGVSASLRTMMRKNINTKSQTRLARDLNRQFAELSQMRRFATAVVATYLATRKRLSVCNAGHPRPLYYHAAAGTWTLLDQGAGEVGNLPLGIDDETPYHQFTVTMGRHDLVLFYTDALIEAADVSGRQLGEEGLLTLARGLEPSDPGRLSAGLLAAVDGHRDGRPAEDDTTLVVLHHNANGPRRPSVAEKLDVYAKVFGLKRV